jgi:hypothetical protein
MIAGNEKNRPKRANATMQRIAPKPRFAINGLVINNSIERGVVPAEWRGNSVD